MKRNDIALTPQVSYTNTKANIEALASPIDGMVTQATDAPYEQGRYANGAWVWGLAQGVIIGPAANILTITNAAPATLALAITDGKTLTLTATDDFNLTIPASGTVALLGVANVFTAAQTINVPGETALLVESAANPVGKITRTTDSVNVRKGTWAIKAKTSADMADGFGPSIRFMAEDDTSGDQYFSEVAGIRDGADNSGALVLLTGTSGSMTEKARVSAAGVFWTNPFSGNSVIHFRQNSVFKGFAGWLSTGTMFFGLDGSAVQGIHVNSSGNVGIGSATIGARLQIIGNADIVQTIIRAHATQTANLQEWQNSSGTVIASVSGVGNVNAASDFLASGSSGYKGIYLNGNTATTARFGKIVKNYDSPFDLKIVSSLSTSKSPIIFELSSDFEAARFLSSGELLIGLTTGTTAKLNVLQTVPGGVGSFSFGVYASNQPTGNNTRAIGGYFQHIASDTAIPSGYSAGIEGRSISNMTTGAEAIAYGLKFAVENRNNGTITTAEGIKINVNNYTASGTGTITTARGLRVNIDKTTGSITTGYGIYLDALSATTNGYGVYLNSVSGAATNNYAFYTNAGDNRFGDDVILNGADSDKLWFGAGKDMSLYYDGTSGYIKTSEVAASDLHITTGAAKTLVLDTSVYDDLQFAVSTAKVNPANTAPTWETFTATTSEYAFSVNDEVDTQANELPHWWKEGTVGNAHLHITTKAVPAQEEKAQFTVTFAYADTNEVWVEAPLTAELTIPISTTALTNFYLDLGDLTLTNYLVGAQIRCRIKRVAKTAGGTEYAGDIFITQCGIHLSKDTMGSRAELTK